MNSTFNKYWPLLALPVAAAIVAVPYLPGPAHTRSDAAQRGTAQASPDQNGAAQNDTTQDGAARNAAPQNDARTSPYQAPLTPDAGTPEATAPQATAPTTPQATAQDTGTRGRSGSTALRRVYDASVRSAVRVNVGDSGIGSGFFMSANGLILTAAHVPLGDSSARLSVTTQAGQDLPVTLVGYDEVRDLAVLKADGQDFPALTLAASTPGVGAGVVAIGNSRGSFDGGRAGAVTALNVSLDPTFPSNMVESSMPLAPGDSGGPVLNAQGEVVGVSTAISNQNGSFASYFVPVTQDSAVLKQLVSGVKRGVPVLGIGVTDARSSTGQDGVLVTSVTPGLGAARAGLKGGTVREFRDASGDVQQDFSGADIIVGVDGRAVSTPAGLVAYLRGKQVGDRVTLRVVRDGRTLNLTVTLSAKPTDQG
ncbi:trypsin-like peptidase domain-containing protein [Deinococcus aquiradiocola]|uniref:PDZ domain-containing protein n=1 Tax=Deinococcus aquiradiocola TaxID=393059 RepID=A0A917URF5_9DEIO|nr:trypsin-like peptidase domain-containing protein [Deinococcus aquiradiocola]GGJ80156.1 hypothetical protein GCM10008939_25080 [Deinococcus aquiradiocola]